MRTPLLLAVLGTALAACGGAVTGGGANPAGAGPGEPHDVASVRLFDSTGGELTFHMPLFDSVPLRVVVRMYAANGRYLTSVTGGQDMQFSFTPAGLASSTPVTGQPGSGRDHVRSAGNEPHPPRHPPVSRQYLHEDLSGL